MNIKANNKVSIGVYKVKSDFRLIGRLFDKKDTTKQLGYVVYFEKSHKLSYMTYDMIGRMLSVYKVHNVEYIEDSEERIKCLDCDITKLPKYILDKEIKTLEKTVSLYILGILKKNAEVVGYKVITNTGKVLDFTSQDIIHYMNKGNTVLNAEIHDNEIEIKQFISGGHT